MSHQATDPLMLALSSAATSLAALSHNVEGARSGADAEPVHDMRVALRRFRAAVSVAKKAGVDILSERLAREVKWLARTLGATRDWDVFAGNWQVLTAQHATAPSQRIETTIAAKRAASQLTLQRALASRRFRQLIDGLQSAIVAATTMAARTKRSGGPRAAADMLTKRAKRMLAHVGDIDALSSETRHELRIATKKLRYEAEIVAPLYGHRRAHAYLRRLMNIQSALGDLNDLEVGKRLVGNAARGMDPACRVALREGWRLYTKSRQPQLQKRLATAWKRFGRAEPFW